MIVILVVINIPRFAPFRLVLRGLLVVALDGQVERRPPLEINFVNKVLTTNISLINQLYIINC